MSRDKPQRLTLEACPDGGYIVHGDAVREGGFSRPFFAGELPAVLDYVARAFEPDTYQRVDVAEMARRMSGQR